MEQVYAKYLISSQINYQYTYNTIRFSYCSSVSIRQFSILFHVTNFKTIDKFESNVQFKVHYEINWSLSVALGNIIIIVISIVKKSIIISRFLLLQLNKSHEICGNQSPHRRVYKSTNAS